MSITQFDPIQYGALQQEVHQLTKQVASLQTSVEALVALANQGRGAFWIGMTLASCLGAASHWALGLFPGVSK